MIRAMRPLRLAAEGKQKGNKKPEGRKESWPAPDCPTQL
jgi:hypothetical protein